MSSKTERSAGHSMTFWKARLLRPSTRADRVAVLAALLLAAVTIVSGRHAAGVLRPASTVDVASMLDELELPTRLPDAPLLDSSGHRETLRARIKGANAVVTFYAAWCEPCQKELPKLVQELGPLADVIVVVDADEDAEATTRQIKNLDVDVSPMVDVTGELHRLAKVTALPSTFLITREGIVLMGSRGYSWMQIYRMKRRIDGEGDPLRRFEP